MTKVKCKRCKWEGDSLELIYFINRRLVPPTCPKCFSIEIEFIR